MGRLSPSACATRSSTRSLPRGSGARLQAGEALSPGRPRRADGSYRVTSLYFDTPYDTALREKLDGVDRREKFRLRYYGELPGFLKLEKKFKVDGLCGKRSPA